MASASEGLDIPPGDIFGRSQLLLQRRNKLDDVRAIAPIATVHGRAEYGMGQDAPAINSVVRNLHHASELCDVILIDASPLPISAHTEYLARVSDVTVLVVKSSATTKQELDRAARLLERLDVAGVAVVLNKISQERSDRAMKKELHGYEQSFRKHRSAPVKDPMRRERAHA
jgi:MinD-like ATPase involved in chromosome partitioning or flagellar assembly